MIKKEKEAGMIVKQGRHLGAISAMKAQNKVG
jgi:hypothetical protein